MLDHALAALAAIGLGAGVASGCPLPAGAERAQAVPGATFARGHGWSLEAGARVVRAAGRGRVLELRPGASAVSAPVCVRARAGTLAGALRTPRGSGGGPAVTLTAVEHRDGTPTLLRAAAPREVDATRRPYRADRRGRRDASPAISRAIAAASRAGGGTVILPRGRYLLRAPVELRDGVVLRGDGMGATTLRAAGPRVEPAALLGRAAATVNDAGIQRLTLDLARHRTNGIQIADGQRIMISRVRVRRAGLNGIVFTRTAGSSTDPTIERSIVQDSGGASTDGADGFGIRIINTERAVVRGNRLVGNRGMGIGLADGTAGAPDGTLVGNEIRTAPSPIGFEAIGITKGSDRALVEGNDIVDSQDNGISLSGSDAIARTNVVRGTLDHGIASAGDRNLIERNVIRDAGREDAGSAKPARAGITLSGAQITVRENDVRDPGPRRAMAYGIKQNQQAGGHRIAGNVLEDYLTERYWFTPAGVPRLSDDTTVDETLPPRPAPQPLRGPGAWRRIRATGLQPPRAGTGGVWVRVRIANPGGVTMQVAAPRIG